MTMKLCYSLLTTSVLALLAACNADQPLVVKDPDVAQPGTLVGAQALPTLSAGSLSDFAVAYAGAADQNNNAHEGVINFGAIFTDEFLDTETFPTRNPLNQRSAVPGNTSLAGVFQNLGSAHNDARRALAQYAIYGPMMPQRAEQYSLDAYIYILVAEHWCSGEPFSSVDVATGKVTNSQFLTTAQMLDTALAEFQLAKQVVASDTVSGDAAANAQMIGLATVGEARALLDLGQVAAAAETAATVPATFSSYQILESVNSLRQTSGLYFYTILFAGFSVGNFKNVTGLPFYDAHDPRVPADSTGIAGNDGTPGYITQEKYPVASAPVTLADSVEAQLIIAEGDIFAGDYGAGRTILESLRSTKPGITLPLTDLTGGTKEAQILQLLTERAFWLYLTGHRLGDWRRVVRPTGLGGAYAFPIFDVYPTGPNISNTLEFPTPLLTDPNPNYKACDPTIP